MLLKRISIENLRSYENQEIIFPGGSTLLSGDIGSGKTTILLAIEFALFGLQPSQKANALMRNDKNESKVLLEFEIDGKNILIERTLKRSKKSISQDSAFMIIGGERFDGSVTEIKSKILKILNYPKEFAKKTNLLYKFTVYTPQEEMKQIILEAGDVRLNTLRHVFGIDKYKRIEENTILLTSKLREKARANEILIANLDQDRDILIQKQKSLNDLKEKYTQVEEIFIKAQKVKEVAEKSLEETREKKEDKRKLESELEKSNIIISEKKQQIVSLSKEIENLITQISELKKMSFDKMEYDSIFLKIDNQKRVEEEIQREYVTVASKINSLELKKLEALSLKSKILGLDKCPTCLQHVSQDYKTNILTNATREIDMVEREVNELNKKKNELIAQIGSAKKTKSDLEKRKSELDLLKIKLENLREKEKRILDIEQRKNLLEKDVLILQKHLQTLEFSIKEYEKYDNIFEERNRELQEAKINESDAAIKKAETKKDIQFTEIEILRKEEEILKKEAIKKNIDKIKELEFWISNKFLEIVLFTEKQVMMALKGEFSKLFSKWFSILVSDLLSAKLDDDFSPIIEQQDYEIDYSFLSGGERTAIALAYRLALNQVINSLLSNIKTSNLVILDEPTDGFSSQQLDKMRDVLSQLDVKQLILVSHEPKMESFVDNIVRIKKENGISKVELSLD